MERPRRGQLLVSGPGVARGHDGIEQRLLKIRKTFSIREGEEAQPHQDTKDERQGRAPQTPTTTNGTLCRQVTSPLVLFGSQSTRLQYGLPKVILTVYCNVECFI